MSLFRATKLIGSLVVVPGGIGTSTHFLAELYPSLMNYEGNFFLVKATQELYDNGIPEIPTSVTQSVEKIVQALKSAQSQTSQVQAASSQQSSDSSKYQIIQVSSEASSPQQKEIFSEKKYWCRYFDYSRGPAHAIMQYDRNCTLYNIFNVGGSAAGTPVAQLASSSLSQTSSQPSQGVPKPEIIDISQINTKSSSLDSTKLKSNSQFKKGAFYLLELDKTKIPGVNPFYHIELTEEGPNTWGTERTYHKKITTLKVKAPLTGNTREKMKFSFAGNLPSSLLLLKKVANGTQAVAFQAGGPPAEQVSESSESSSSQDQQYSYILKRENETQGQSQDHVTVLNMYTVPVKGSQGESLKSLDLTLLDKVSYKPWEKQAEDDGKSSNNGSSITSLLGNMIWSLIGPALVPKESEKYYLVKTVSDFWKYNKGEKVTFYKVTETPKPSRRRRNTETQSAQERKETQLAKFEVVTGLLAHVATPLRCLPPGDWLSTTALRLQKPGFRESGKLYTEAKNPEFCKNKNNLPPYTIILLGTDSPNEEKKK
ncbi:hypothetical protein MHLP_02400 [Candidatus Mycoplasma haematolamae str. Purdue]|uniref:Uncharacterized protein n=1 Tax=Mycoplasma haematolamae (strain Purdue) TaxID=1212765 RepID=I7B9W4_MYCHA|nr:hypothetical protein [Candidatus Mycoplasma haematolamae]AFO52060.1 hypothetical protein MHLP_02400 [Candidatus Mycoplasma haematolamae str. Purdue]